MKKIIMNLALTLRRVYWWTFRPKTRGVRAIITNPQGLVLLVRHSYGNGWYLPGGRVSGREDDVTALRRELKEELGIAFDEIPRQLGEYENFQEYKRDVIAVFVITSYSRGTAHDLEIEDVKFFSLDQLPKDVSPGTRRRIEEWNGARDVTRSW